MSNKSIVDQIRHYQKDIERCPDNSERMMRCIQRLYVMPILVQHLQETGIGRSVNSLKKNNGEVGDAAKALVNKWKKMVAEEESDDACNNSVEKSDDSKNPPAAESIENPPKPRKVANDRPKSDSKDLDHSTRHSSQKRSHHDNDGSKVDKKSRSSSKDRRSDEKSSSSSKDKRHEKSHRSESSHKRKDESSKKSSSSSREHSHSEMNKSEQTDKKKSKESSQHEERKHSSSRTSHSSKEHHRKERSRNGSDRDADDSPLPKKRKKTCIKERRKHQESAERSSSSERDNSAGSEFDRRSPNSARDDGDSDSSDGIRTQDFDGHSDDDSAKEQKEPERQKNSSHSSSSSRPKPKESSKEKILENGKKIKQEKIDPAYEGYNSPSIKGSPSGNSKNKTVKVKVDTSNDDGIDAGSGFSFADALAGLDPSSGKKKKKSIKPDLIVTTPSSSTKSHSSKSDSKKEKPSTSSGSSKDRSSHLSSRNSPLMMPSSSVKREPSSGSSMPELLLKKPMKLESLDLDINSTLPEINPNYRPLPHVPENARRNSTTKTITNDEEMFSMMMNKNQRTKVFSGGKTGGRINKVPSLYELCIKLLYDNIDGLEFTGGVPFDLLKPLLEKLNPDQLFVLEHYNSYLIEDTGPMWEFHCKKDFRTATRQDMETWRELYVRCMEEREEKLKALTQNITKSIAQSVPVRKAQLAYVNSAVKPPRNVAKKQAKYGTGDSPGICPSLKSNSAEKREILNKAVVGASNGTVLATTTVPPPPPASAPRASSSWSAPVAPQSQKKRKAPLMAKTLQLMKGNRFKR